MARMLKLTGLFVKLKAKPGQNIQNIELYKWFIN